MISSTMPWYSSSRRWASEPRRGSVMAPHSTRRPGAGLSTTPYPVTAVPGSIPSTLTSLGHRRQRFGVNVKVGMDLGDVVHFLQRVDELEERPGVLLLHLDRALRQHRDPSALHGDLLRAELILHGVKLVGRRRDQEAVAVRDHIFGAGIERRLERRVLVRFGCVYRDLSLAVEHPGHRVRRTEIAAEPREEMPHFGDRAGGFAPRPLD